MKAVQTRTGLPGWVELGLLLLFVLFSVLSAMTMVGGGIKSLFDKVKYDLERPGTEGGTPGAR
jgi:uncharacterized membrane protein YhdT